MRADHLSYRRGMIVCLWGWIGQTALGLLLLILALVFDNQVAGSGAGLVLIGSVVWLVLAILYDAHRRERIEAMEAEALDAAGARDGSVFESGEDLRVASRRLEWMHKWLVPAASLLLATAFALFGLARLGIWPFGPWSLEPIRALLSPRNFTVPGYEGVFIAVGLVLGAGGFVFARYVSGMAKQPVWSNLRGGAAQAAGLALVGLALTVCEFLITAKVEGPIRYLNVILPIVSVFMGAEILLNFVLTMYRPRRPGEFPRPAFDSRVLAFVAAPDRIAESFGEALNYQFGIDVTSSWFYQLVSRSLLWLIVVGVLVTWAMSAVTVVRANERALLLRLGRIQGEPLQPGVHVKWPWPVDRVQRYDTTAIRRLDLASGSPTEGEAILWTKKHTEDEQYLIVQAAPGKTDASQDVSLVSVEIPLFYVVNKVTDYINLAPDGMRDDLLRAVGKQEVMQILAQHPVDEVLGRGRNEISAQLMSAIQAAYDRIGAGVTVTFAGISGAHPPIDAASAFEAVVQAEQNRKAMLEQAQGDRIKTLSTAVGGAEIAENVLTAMDELSALRESGAPETQVAEQATAIADMIAAAGGNAASEIHDAEGDRWSLHMAERARLARYQGQLAGFEAAPSVYMADRYLRTLRKTLEGVRLLVLPEDAKPWLILEEEDPGANSLLDVDTEGL